MIDLKALQKDYKTYVKQLQKKKIDSEVLEILSNLINTLKSSKALLEKAQAEQNSNSKLFAIYQKEKKDINELKAILAQNKKDMAIYQEKVREDEEALNNIALTIPNLPDNDVPEGQSEDDNVEIKKVLSPKNFNFKPKEHWELSEQNGWINFETGVKLAKSRFSILAKDGAKLERSLINYMLDFNAKYGFEEVSLPLLVNSDTMRGTGQLPKFEDDLFKISDEDLYLIPTAEVPLTNMYADEILNIKELPIRLTAHTPCFRKEAGSGGRDIRGLIRQHQFHKVELVAITTPENSDEMMQTMVDCASALLKSLELPHRLVNLCGGDLGFSASRTIDIEVWLPAQNKYREISSISNTRDFQASRAKIRYKKEKKNIFVHTLNGSSLAVGRTLLAIMENGQNEDGSINIPEVLKPYMKI
jgi:seryl-tRNA synthetase